MYRTLLPRSAPHVQCQWLIIFGVVVLIVAGLLWPVLQRLSLGRLAGDIVFERENVRFYFPIVTSLIISVVSRSSCGC